MRYSLIAIALAASTPAGAAPLDGWRAAGRAGEVALVAVALGKTVADGDRAGVGQLALGMSTTVATTETLKRFVGSKRPNGRDDRSFPSGHTSISFGAAAHLHARHGWQWGAPALATAGLVGLSRVEAREHRWIDVAAGALLGTVSAHVFTSPYDSTIRLLPWGDTQGGGVVARMTF